MRLALCLLLALYGFSSVAHAQKQSHLERQRSQLEASLKTLEATFSNVNDMAVSVPGREYLSVSNATHQIERVVSRYHQTLNVSAIALVMIDRRDYQTVLKYLTVQCLIAKQISASAVKTINSTLVEVTANAMIAELTKARDLIQGLDGAPLCASS